MEIGEYRLPCCAFEEIVGLSVHEVGPEFAHFLLHLPHLSVEALPNARELRVND